MEKEIRGVGFSRTCVIGKLHFLWGREELMKRSACLSASQSGERGENELQKLDIALGEILEGGNIQKANTAKSLASLARENIFRGHSAESAVKCAAFEIALGLCGDSDPFLNKKSAPVLGACRSVLGYMDTEGAEDEYMWGQMIAVCQKEDMWQLSAAEKSLLLGVAFPLSSPFSEEARLALAMGAPVITSCGELMEHREEYEGKTAILDAEKGVMILSPTEETLMHYGERIASLAMEKKHSQLSEKYAWVCSEGDLSDLPNEIKGVDIFADRLSGLSEKEITSLFLKASDFGALRLFLSPNEKNHISCLGALRRVLAERKCEIDIMHTEVKSVKDIEELVAACRKNFGEDAQRLGVGVHINNPAAFVLCEHIAERCDEISLDTDFLFQLIMGDDLECSEALFLAVKQVMRAAERSGVPFCFSGISLSRRQIYKSLRSLDKASFSLPFLCF